MTPGAASRSGGQDAGKTTLLNHVLGNRICCTLRKGRGVAGQPAKTPHRRLNQGSRGQGPG
jgi:hypothetical protein